MQKKALTVFGALLISGLAVQAATAAEHHKRFRNAYNQVTGPVETIPVMPHNRATYGLGYGYDFLARDPSRVGGQDADLRPAAN
jgi:hypothetical protein